MGAMFRDEDGFSLLTRDVQVGVTPGVQVTGSAQGLSRVTRATLAQVVYEEDGGLVLALQLAEEAEDIADVCRGVLIGAMKADEGVQHEEPGLDAGQGQRETVTVRVEVEPERRFCDESERQAFEFGSRGPGDAGDTFPDGAGWVLCGVEQDGARIADGEASEGWHSSGDGHREIESEPCLSGLGDTADEADGLFGPEVFDEPSCVFRDDGKIGDTGDCKGIHGRILRLGVRSKTSR
jgi:hypothetical protein